MGEKFRGAQGVRYHKRSDGTVGVCTASVRNCPFKLHFDTEADARDGRTRYFVMDNMSGAPYSVTVDLSGESTTPPTEEFKYTSIRAIADQARAHLISTGQTLRHPNGKFEIDFGGSSKLVIARENFMSKARYADKAATRYYMTFWPNATSYEVEIVEIQPDKDERYRYEEFQNHIQEFANQARDEHFRELSVVAYQKGDYGLKGDRLEEADPAYDEAIKKVTANAMKTIDHLEILARGAEEAHKKLGIDLFAKDEPGELDLDMNFSTSAIQPYDIVNSLKLHALEDEQVKKVSITVTDEVDPNVQPGQKRKGKPSSWTITRIPEGSWYFSYEKDEEFYTNELTHMTAQDAREAVEYTLGSRFKNNPELLRSRTDFVYSLLTDVEPAIQSYERTMEARLASKQQAPQLGQASPPQAEQAQAAPQKTMKDKLFGLFS